MSSDQTGLAASRPRPGSDLLLAPTVKVFATSTLPSSQTSSSHASERPPYLSSAAETNASVPPDPNRPSPLPRPILEHEPEAGRAIPPPAPPRWLPDLDQARDIVALFQCPLCALPYRDVVTLPCGRSVCSSCLPTTHIRTSITYPASPSRLRAFYCPFRKCRKEHVLDDCGPDVLLNKLAHLFRLELDKTEREAQQRNAFTAVVLAGATTSSRPLDTPASRLEIEDDGIDASWHTLRGGKLMATWILASQGNLPRKQPLRFRPGAPPSASSSSSSSSRPSSSSSSPSPTASLSSLSSPSTQAETARHEIDALARLEASMRNEVDCQVCYTLFYDPVTTGCGHTFCRPCLLRILDHARRCPICRRKLAMNPLLTPTTCPSNRSVISIIRTFWKDELAAREDTVAAERAVREQDAEIPLFVCTLSFPMMPTFLHVFEPRYRLMIRRALEGDQTFGMVLSKRPQHGADPHFYELGTLLRIVNVHYYPDGRSLIETVGVSRFRVVRHGQLDGYTVGKLERIDDVSLDEEEAMEAAEVGYDNGLDPPEMNSFALTSRPHEDVTDSASGNGKRSERSARSKSADGSVTPDSGSVAAGGSPSASHSPHYHHQHHQHRYHFDEPVPETPADLDTMSTQSLMRFAMGFVARMRDQSVPWLTQRMLAIYGECPDDPAVFPWWFASTLPVREHEKYRLLGTSSVRDRLKICGSWIIEMKRASWSMSDCIIL